MLEVELGLTVMKEQKYREWGGGGFARPLVMWLCLVREMKKVSRWWSRDTRFW